LQRETQVYIFLIIKIEIVNYNFRIHYNRNILYQYIWSTLSIFYYKTFYLRYENNVEFIIWYEVVIEYVIVYF